MKKVERFGSETLESIKGELFYGNEIFGDRYCVFIFHPDTLEKYSWEEVVSGYKILCRYDSDVPLDIERLDKTIPYPPTKAMSGMKVYDPCAVPDSVAEAPVLQPEP